MTSLSGRPSSDFNTGHNPQVDLGTSMDPNNPVLSVQPPVTPGLSNEHGSAPLKMAQETEDGHAQLLAVGVPSEPYRAGVPQKPTVEDEDESGHESDHESKLIALSP